MKFSEIEYSASESNGKIKCLKHQESIGSIQLSVMNVAIQYFDHYRPANDTASLKGLEKEKKSTGKTVVARFEIISLTRSFGDVKQTDRTAHVSSIAHWDSSENHTFTIKYHSRSSLQKFGILKQRQDGGVKVEESAAEIVQDHQKRGREDEDDKAVKIVRSESTATLVDDLFVEQEVQAKMLKDPANIEEVKEVI
jgi:hypothetical protein